MSEGPLHALFSRTILQWFCANGRLLPWRETTDPYAIWLSEVILQQTRIAQGMAYWQRFMQTYPTVQLLAAADEDDVLRLWQGLGYYSRARNLHAAARQIVDMGAFPRTLETIRTLKGVGDYTAAAIGSFAFDIPVAVLDGNVFRVLARYFGIDTPVNTTPGKKLFAALAQSLLPQNTSQRFRPDGFSLSLSAVSAYNQGIMDFGALVCTPQTPRCEACPLAETCLALREGRVDCLPVKNRTQRVKTRYLTYIYIRWKKKESSVSFSSPRTSVVPMVAMRRRGGGDIWQGLWEPYNASLHEDSAATAEAEIIDMLQLASSDTLRLLARGVKHVLTHRILLADFYLLETEERPLLPDDYVWIKESDLAHYGVPRLIEKLCLLAAGKGDSEAF